MQHETVYLLFCKFTTCFGCQPHPSSGVHKTVTTASGTGHIFCAATSLRGHVNLVTFEGDSCIVPEAVFAVLWTPDDGCGWHPKHVKRINRLLCVAPRWTITDTVWGLFVHNSPHEYASSQNSVLLHDVVCRRVPESQFYCMDVSRAILLQIVLINL